MNNLAIIDRNACAAQPPLDRPFRADQVGSLLRPQALKDLHAKALKGEVDTATLHEAEDRFIREVVALQQDIGLHAITDGEFRRTLFHADFLGQLEDGSGGRPVSFEFRRNAEPTSGQAAPSFLPPGVKIKGKVRRVKPIEVEPFRFLATTTSRTPKQAIPSPTMLLRGGRRSVDATAYPDLDQFLEDVAIAYRQEIADLSAVGCRYLQLDDTNFAYLCDPRIVDAMRAAGEDIEGMADRFASIINAAIAERPKDMLVCIHVCRGNDRGRSAAQGGYEPVADVLFNRTNVDAYFLEYDTEAAGGFEPLRHLPKNKTVVLGLISSKVPELADSNDIVRRIEAAAQFAPLDNLCLSPQCGFASGFRGNPLAEEQQRHKLEQTVSIAERVWGTAR
jgi:5-methyltetrahydropteroyltriglutamate--homocysteine methyltransferase